MNSDINKYKSIIREYAHKNYSKLFREEGEFFKYPFIVPGSSEYDDVLWDWDSWLTDVAITQIVEERPTEEKKQELLKYQEGCIKNFLEFGALDGWIPIMLHRKSHPVNDRPKDVYEENMHKPVFAQHTAFIVKYGGGDAEWLREKFLYMQTFLNNYRTHHRHQCGLYYWQSDAAIGVDNDPCTFFRPRKSSGSIYLNSLMYKEIKAMEYLCKCMNLDEIAEHYRADAEDLKNAINEHCWDERDGFYYSVDLNLLPTEAVKGLHFGLPRHWDCLIQRIGVWSGFLALWAGIASQEQAERVVAHYRDERGFNSPFGVRTLSKYEKMYNVRATGNPSNWLGPIWGVSNYLTFRGLIKYGFNEEAKELCEKTIRLLGRDIERFNAMHEYYQPENGEPILNRGFQNWNLLVVNMINWLEGKQVVAEF